MIFRSLVKLFSLYCVCIHLSDYDTQVIQIENSLDNCLVFYSQQMCSVIDCKQDQYNYRQV